MIAYLPVTEHGSPAWEKARHRKRVERRVALQDVRMREAFEKKYGHSPEEFTIDEFQEPHVVMVPE